jgi:HD-GYP domain-containing protein (c-di-GMP phosphodiesterase class II)
VLTVFCVLTALVVTAVNLTGFAVATSPIMAGLVITVWGAVLGLTALLVGTLSDERKLKAEELHYAYVGVVEVLSRYLQSANPKLKARSTRVAELCHAVSVRLRLPARQIEDIRVAALLGDIGKIEITAKLINRAVDTLDADAHAREHDTVHGADLVHSLEGLLHGAIPILLSQDAAAEDYLSQQNATAASRAPIGAKIIRVVRAYDAMTEDGGGATSMSPADAVAELRADASAAYDREVLDALEEVVVTAAQFADAPPQLVR